MYSYSYYESCVCGSNTSLQSPTGMNYEWTKQVESWRENHKHERINLNPIYPTKLGGGFDSAKFTPENMVDYEEALKDLEDPNL